MRGILLLMLGVGLVVLTAPGAVAETSHHYNCAADAAGCATTCANHIIHHVHEGSLPGVPPCLIHP